MLGMLATSDSKIVLKSFFGQQDQPESFGRREVTINHTLICKDRLPLSLKGISLGELAVLTTQINPNYTQAEVLVKP
jgi:hypothetical protein